jgi:hypothetical protein
MYVITTASADRASSGFLLGSTAIGRVLLEAMTRLSLKVLKQEQVL